MNFQPDNDREDISEINMIPLVDIMLVLLIVFMVAAPLSVSGIKVDLPSSKAKSLAKAEERKLVLSIDKSGQFFLNDILVDRAKLSEEIKKSSKENQAEVIFIRADRQANYGDVVDGMTSAKLAGIPKLNMLTKLTK